MMTLKQIAQHSPSGIYAGFVFLVFGNSGYDLISDYSVRLEDFLKEAIALSTKLEEETI